MKILGRLKGGKNMAPIIIGIIIVTMAIGLGSDYFLGDDNPIEEEAEAILEDETGVDIDFSPTTPEQK